MLILFNISFKGLMGQFGLRNRWLKMGSEEKSRAILLLLDHLELWDREERLRGARAVLYLAQVINSFSTKLNSHKLKVIQPKLFHRAAGRSACQIQSVGIR